MSARRSDPFYAALGAVILPAVEAIVTLDAIERASSTQPVAAGPPLVTAA